MTRKKMIIVSIWSAVIIAWVGLFAFRLTTPGLQIWALAVTGVAIITEIGFWSTAAVLGIGLWESRKRVFGWISRPFKRG